MIRLLPFLLSMALCSPAFAFTAGNIVTYSDTTGAKVQDSGVSAIGVASHVATLAALQASTTATYPNGVWRDDYAAGNGAPPLWFLPESGTCVANSRVNDGGSCVDANGGNSFVSAPADGIDNPIQYGADPTGSADSYSAVQNAINATVLTKRYYVRFPGGKYKIGTGLAYTFTSAAQSLTIEGAGQAATTAFFPVGGLTVNYFAMQNSVHIRNMRFTTGSVGAYNGIVLQNTGQVSFFDNEMNDITNVSFQGDDGPQQTDYWINGVVVTTVSGVTFLSDQFYSSVSNQGTGIGLSGYNKSGVTNADTTTGSAVLHFASTPVGLVVGMAAFDVTTNAGLFQTIQSITGTTVTLTGNAANPVTSGDTIKFQNPGFEYNVISSNFNGMAIGIVYGTGVQGLTVSGGCNIGGIIGILAPAGGFSLTQLTVIGNQFQTSQYTIAEGSFITDTIIEGNLFYVPDNTGNYPAIYLPVAARFAVNGNQFTDIHNGGVAPTAILVGNNEDALGGVITSNDIFGFGTGVLLGSTTGGITVAGNAYTGTTTPVTDMGTGNFIGVTASGSPSSDFATHNGFVIHN